MVATVHTIPMGIDHVYIVKDRGTAIIDGGEPKKGKVFLKVSEKPPSNPKKFNSLF